MGQPDLEVSVALTAVVSKSTVPSAESEWVKSKVKSLLRSLKLGSFFLYIFFFFYFFFFDLMQVRTNDTWVCMSTTQPMRMIVRISLISSFNTICRRFFFSAKLKTIPCCFLCTQDSLNPLVLLHRYKRVLSSRMDNNDEINVNQSYFMASLFF